MEWKYIVNDKDNNRLILFFTGWSTDGRILSTISFPGGYDVIAMWDYRSLSIPEIEKEYMETVVLAWSFGVSAADYLYEPLKVRFNPTGMFAIAGSTHPAHNKWGIDEEVYENTRLFLNENTLKKFRIRIAGGLKNYTEKSLSFPETDNVENLREELMATRSRQSRQKSTATNGIWDRCIICGNDAIFPLKNLQEEWSGTPVTILENEPHYPDFQKIIDTIIRDKELIRSSFTSKLGGYDAEADVQKLCARKLWEITAPLLPTSAKVLEIGRGSGFLSRLISSDVKCVEFVSVDLVEPQHINPKETALCGDGETLPRQISSDSFDLIVSSSTVQWFHSLKRFLCECHRLLKKDGLVALATFTEGTLENIAKFTDRRLPYYKPSEIEKIGNDMGFCSIVSEFDFFDIEFSGPHELLRHLSRTGVNAISRKRTDVETIKKIINDYPRENDGNVKLEFPTYFIILRKR